MKLKFLAPALLAGFVAFTSCSKEDDKKPEPAPKGNGVKEVKYLDASDQQKWVYFSFEKGVVEVADPQTSNDWDLAFNRYHVRTNSGTSGKGQGGAYKTDKTDFDAVTVAPTAEEYKVDVEQQVSSFLGGKGGNQKISLSPVLEIGHGEGFWEMIKDGVLAGASKGIPGYDQLTEEQKKAALAKMEQRIKPTLIHNNGWLTMDYKKGSSGPSYTYNNWVYVVKTAAGKYAKVQLTDYKDAKEKTGFITFKYLVF
ncbi:HmuY family protein [Capnocytophaga granulosa]|uniref:HmuY family protein n=1 Tax=Capnocytophaga granulosa TaxID=45242 RepID=UPI003C73261F